MSFYACRPLAGRAELLRSKIGQMKIGLFSLVTLALHGIGSLGFVPGVPGISWEFLFF